MASLNSSTGSAQRSAQGNGCPVFPHSEKGIGNERGLKAIVFFHAHGYPLHSPSDNGMMNISLVPITLLAQNYSLCVQHSFIKNIFVRIRKIH